LVAILALQRRRENTIVNLKPTLVHPASVTRQIDTS
jgi:hypothetical protein